MKRLTPFCFLVMLVPFFLVPHALAAKPSIHRIPIDDEFVLEDQCVFPVNVDATGILVDIVFTDEDGTVHEFQAYPQYKAVLTNLDTGESITLNLSGPASFTFNPDGSFTLKGTGNWLWFPHPATGDPGIFQTAGHVILSVDAEGNASWTLSGRIVDVCSQLD
jgi:hypothetical protein